MSASSLASRAAHAPARVPVRRASVSRRASVARRAGVVVRADSSSAPKVVVLGGSGFVGSRVVEKLAAAGAEVVSVSKSGAGANGVAVDLSTDACADALADAMKGADVVVSCVGVFDPADDDKARAGNGDFNVRGVNAAKAAGARRFVYVSVADIVKDTVGGAVMKGYFEGKSATERAVADAFPGDASFLVKPSFIYGGDAFSLNPPRVTQQYGDVLVKLLGSGAVKAIAEKAPGPIALTLAEPQSVDDVAAATAAAALGKCDGASVDGADDIKACAAKLA